MTGSQHIFLSGYKKRYITELSEKPHLIWGSGLVSSFFVVLRVASGPSTVILR